MPGQAGETWRLLARDSPVGKECGQAVDGPAGARAARGGGCSRRGPLRMLSRWKPGNQTGLGSRCAWQMSVR